jgi:uncharacterized membrane protein YukC
MCYRKNECGANGGGCRQVESDKQLELALLYKIAKKLCAIEEHLDEIVEQIEECRDHWEHEESEEEPCICEDEEEDEEEEEHEHECTCD